MIRQVVGVLGYVALFAALLFGPAGTFRWRAAWVLLAMLLIARSSSTMLLYRDRRDLLAERAKLPLQRGQPLADRILLPAFMASFAALIAFASWDRWHLHLLPASPALLRAAGLVSFLAGWWIVHLALRANAFAVTVVRHQTDRGHDVVTTGPYAIVRHPMYAGIVPSLVGVGLWLGSTAAVLGAAVPILILMTRIIFEERVLRRTLPEYASYASRVRWRLVPGIW
jgi:protein-S-isoprenylcysteine O-methyltransferase Ste14